MGLDIDPVMLAAARRHRPRRQEWPIWVAADMRRFMLVRRFSLVFVAYNSLQLLTVPGDMAACLRVAGAHLAPGGLVGVEVTDFQRGGADGPDDARATGEVLARAEGICLSGTLAHDLAARTSCYRRHFEGEGWAVDNEVRMRSLDRAELESIFRDADLTPTSWSPDGPMVRAVAAPKS